MAPLETASPSTDAILTIAPCVFAASMRRAASCAQKKTASRLIERTFRHSSGGISTARPPCAMPALLTRIVTVPKAFSVASKARIMAARSVTSASAATARPPFFSISSFSALSRSTRRATSATAAPLSESARANCVPSPLEAPVTSATRPLRLNMSAAFMQQPLYTGSVTIWNRGQKTRNYLASIEWAGDVERIWQAAINSWNGLVAVTRSEAAFRQELILLAAGVPLAFFLTAETGKRFALIGVIVFVLIVELLNTAIEKLSDRVTRDNDPAIKRVKDMGSAAVGLSLLGAGVVWLWILIERFWP